MIILYIEVINSWACLQLTQTIESLTSIFPGDSDDKESVCNVGDPNLIPGLEQSSGEGNSNQL